MSGSTEVLVLGAGPAGLAAAYRLARAGREVTVLEQGVSPGGLAGSFEVAGVRVDHGSHRLHPSCPREILATLEVLGCGLQRRHRHGRIRLGGRWVAFPPRPADLARRLPPGFALGVLGDMLAAPLRRPAGADTFAEVVRAGLGATIAGRFYAPYARKIWGLDPADLSGELARRRVSAVSRGGLWRKLLPRPRDTTAGVFYYPRRGFGTITERLAQAAADAGARVVLGTEVTGVEVGPDRVRAHVASHGHPLLDEEAAHAWSTLPLPVLARLTRPAPEAAAVGAAARLEYRALVLVYLVLDRPRYTEFDAHYFPEGDVPFSRVSEPKRYRDGAGVDPPDMTALCAEVPCAVGDERWNGSDDALGGLVADGLASQGLPGAEPAAVAVRRVRRAYPVYRVGCEDAVGALDDWARGLPRLLTFGRQGLFVHDNTHHALAMGWAAADALGDDGEVDAARWAAARREFATHVVED